MKAGKMFAKNIPVFCAFTSECDFKKTISEEKSPQPKTGCTACTWKGRCNQQIETKQKAEALLTFVMPLEYVPAPCVMQIPN
jgi:hypothetical protein